MTNFHADQFCDGCGVEITWAPYLVTPASAQTAIPATAQRRAQYCCQDCAEGLRCKCGERMLLEDERRQSDALPEI